MYFQQSSGVYRKSASQEKTQSYAVADKTAPPEKGTPVSTTKEVVPQESSTQQKYTYLVTTYTLGNGAGKIISSPAGIRCGAGEVDCDEKYVYGTALTLTATPSTGSVFDGWLGNCAGTSPTCTVSMDTAKQITALFNLGTSTGGRAGVGSAGSTSETSGNASGSPPAAVGGAAVLYYTITVTKAGSGTGTIISEPIGIDCGGTCSHSYGNGSIVTLGPTAASSSNFSSWSGCDAVVGTYCQVLMNRAKTVTVTFTAPAPAAPVNYTLAIDKSGAGKGLVSSEPGGIKCAPFCSDVFESGTSVLLTQEPFVGSVFAGWSGGGCSGTGECTITMNSGKSVTATYNILTLPLTLEKSGTGDGKVTSNPYGIQCESGCTKQTANFNYATKVTLSITLYSGNTFGGWTGACSGAGAIPTCTVNMTSAKNVGVIFNHI